MPPEDEVVVPATGECTPGPDTVKFIGPTKAKGRVHLKCSLCGKEYKYANKLRDHINAIHGPEAAINVGVDPDVHAMFSRVTKPGENPFVILDEKMLPLLLEAAGKGIPLDTICDGLRMDKDEVDRIRSEGMRTKKGFAGRMAVDLAQAEARFMSMKINVMLNGDMDRVTAAKAYLSIFKPRYANAARLSIQHEILGMLYAVKDALGMDIARRVADAIAHYDTRAAYLAAHSLLTGEE